MNYKAFKTFNNGIYEVFLEKIEDIEGEKYYEYIKSKKSKGKVQIILTMMYLLDITSELLSEYDIKNIELDIDEKNKKFVQKGIEIVNQDKVSFPLLPFALMGLIGEDEDNIKISSITLYNDEQMIELKVNGIIKFKKEPSSELKKKIAKTIENRFNDYDSNFYKNGGKF